MRIHPHPKNWRNGVSGDYRTTPRKRGGVLLWFRGVIIFDAPDAKVAHSFAARHAAGEIAAEPWPRPLVVVSHRPP